MKKEIYYKKKIYYSGILIAITRTIIPLILYFLKTRIKQIKGYIQKKGAVLIAVHHEELADQFVIAISTKRKLCWIADTTSPSSKRSLADAWFTKWLFMRLGAVPIDKKNPKRNKNLFNYLLFLLQRGQAIVFFPEAYVSSERNDEKFGVFKDGVVRLALEYEKTFNKKIPVYPIGLKYTKIKFKKEVSLNIGKPIYLKERKDSFKLFDELKRLS